jgi:probable H4MPT-linked C1 transfer pathway protein
MAQFVAERRELIQILGWDIGGANVKAAWLEWDGGIRTLHTASRPFEIWRRKEELGETLCSVAAELPPARSMAVTMTAELADAFRNKREGVNFVLDALADAFPGAALRIFKVDGTFVSPAEARADHLAVAASNWAATAHLVARHVSAAVMVDVGSTTTDLIPIAAGRVIAHGRTDPERLLAGELLYTGALRTNVAAVVQHVPLWGGECLVAAEYFAITGDVYLLLGELSPQDYSCSTPDGRPPTAQFAAERLARVVCADAEMLSRDDILAIAGAVAEAQVAQVAAALQRVAARLERRAPAIVTGLGAFIARRAAERCGLETLDLSAIVGVEPGNVAPAVAVAWLLAQEHEHRAQG